MTTKKLFLPAAIIALNLLALNGFAQNVGIGTATPNAKLDINGSFSTREGAAFSNTQLSPSGGPFNDVALPSANSFFRIPSGLSNITGPFTINGFAGGHDGQELVITNQSGYDMNLSNLSVSDASPANEIILSNGSSTLDIPSGSTVTLKYSVNVSNSSSNGVWLVTSTAVPVGTGSGSVTSIATGTGLTGGPITTIGTISLANTAVSAGSYGDNADVATFTVNAQGQLTAAGSTPISASAIGAVTSVSSGTLSPLFTTSVATPTSTPAISYSLSNAGIETIFGNNTGSSAAPTYFSPTLASALFANQGTTTTVLHGNASGNPSWSQIGLATDVTGILPVTNGGTGVNTLTSKGIIYGNGTSAVGVTAAGTTGQILTNNSGTPLWSTATYPATTTADQLLYSSANNTVTGLAAGSNGQALEMVSGVPTWTTITASAVNGWALTGNGSTTAGTDFVGTTDANDLVFKTDASENVRISESTGNLVIGSGEGTQFPAGNTIRAPYATNANRTGADLTIAPGAPSGKGGSGNIIFQGLAANVGAPGNNSDLGIMVEDMRITNTGAISFGSTGTATGNANNVLISGSSTTNPSWGQLPLNDNVNAVTGTLAANNGGTGQSTYTIGDILYASTTSALSKLSDVATGKALISGGVGAAPTWGQLSLTTGITGILPIANGGTNSGTALSGSGIMISNGTQIVQGAIGTTTTVLHGNASGVPTYSAVSLTTDVSGTLPVANGGTGATTLTSKGIIYGNGTSAVGVTAAGTTGQILTNSSGTPLWTTATYPATITADQLLYSSGTNTVAGLTAGSNGQVLSMSSGVPTWVTPSSIFGSGTTNYVARWTSATALGTGIIQDNGTTVGVDNAPNGTDLVYINNSAGNATTSALHATTTSGIDFYFGYEPNFTLASGQVCSAGIGAFCNSTAGNALVSSTSVAGGSGIIGNSTSGKGIYGINDIGSQGSLAGYPYGAVVGFAVNATSGIGVIGIGNGANANANSDIPAAGSGGAFMGSTRGVFGEYTNTTGGGVAVEGLTANGVDPTFSSTSQDFGVLGMGSTTGTDAAVAGYVGTFATPAAAAGVYGSSSSATVYAIYANNTSGTGVNGNGLFVNGTSAFQGTATLGVSSSNTGVLIYDNSSNANTVTIQSGATTTSYALTLPLAQGGSGTVLTNNGAGVLSWGTSSGGVTSVTASSPLASSGGTTPNISLTGTIPVANGGTNLTSYTAGSLLDASATTTVGQIADVTAGSYLRSAGSGTVPVWSTLTLPNAATTGDILYASGTNAIGNLSDVATGNVLISGGTSTAPSWGKVGLTTTVSGILPAANGGTGLSTAASNGQLLIGNGTGYTLGTLTAGSNITITNTAGAITIASSGSSSGWNLTGNGSTTPGTDFVGTTDANDLIFKTGGTEDMRIDNATGNVVIGAGDATATVTGNTLRGPAITGTNKAGVNLTIQPGNGTGTGGSGNIIFQTAGTGSTGSTANTITEAMRITPGGIVAINTAAPASDALLAIKDGHIEIQQTTATTVAVGTGAGSGFGANAPSASLTDGTDAGGTLTIKTGSTAGTATNPMATVTFNQAYTTTPIIVITPIDANSGAAESADGPYVIATTTGFSFYFSTAVASKTFNFNYMVLETH